MTSSTSTTTDKERECTALDDDDAASYDFIRFTMADIHGISRSKLVPRRHIANMLSTGITMCSGTTIE